VDQRPDLERGDPFLEGDTAAESIGSPLGTNEPLEAAGRGPVPPGVLGDPVTDVMAARPGSGTSEVPSALEDDVDEVEAQRIHVEQTRADMSETIDAIQEKMSPANLAQQAKDTVKDATIGKAQQVAGTAGDTATGMGSSIVETVQRNPVPAALIGIGLGWLLMSGRKQSASQPSFPSQKRYAYRDVGLDPYRGQYQEQSGSPVGQALGQAQQTAGQVQQTAQQVVGQAQQQAGQLATGAQQQAQQAASGFQQLLQENPLTVGVVGLALGAAVGLAIPETQAEDQLMGQARGTLMDKAQQTAQDTAQKVQNIAQEAVGAAKQEAQDQGLTQ
jgi:ElaB/YqjD/DUF883 family membrane-anchored ribosome-binding protein